MVCLRDNAFPVALQRLFVTEIDAVSAKPTTVVEIDTSHSPFLSQPAELATSSRTAQRGYHVNHGDFLE